jgi:hypothetical protein
MAERAGTAGAHGNRLTLRSAQRRSGAAELDRVPVVEQRDELRRGVGQYPAPGMNSRLAYREKTLWLGCIHYPD